MPRPQLLVDYTDTAEGRLELRKRGDRDFMILIQSRVLMTSYITSSELFLAESGCALVAARTNPHVLIGGLGLGFTLRAALDALPRKAKVVVAELNPKVIEWCQGPVAEANGGAALDRRVEFFEGDVTALIAQVAKDEKRARFDAILWDLYVGPSRKGGATDPLYGDDAVCSVSSALSAGGIFGVWGETPSTAFEERLKKYGFRPELHRSAGGGLKHAIYLAEKRRTAVRSSADKPTGHSKLRTEALPRTTTPIHSKAPVARSAKSRSLKK